MGCGNSTSTLVGDDHEVVEIPDSPLWKRYDDRIMESLTSLDRFDEAPKTLLQTRHASSIKGAKSAAEGASDLPLISKESMGLQRPGRENTVIIFDWDDTLCPSSWAKVNCMVGDHCRGKPRKRRNQWLLKSAVFAASLLKQAKTLGHVVIVTNARRPWVNISCDALMPEVADVLHDIPIIYAREFLTDADVAGCSQRTAHAEAKKRAMKAVVSSFQCVFGGQDLKNVVCIGDSQYEHEAIRHVMVRGPHNTESSHGCHTKTIKLLQHPSLKGMCFQLSLLSRWLPKIVGSGSDVAIDFGDIKDNVL